MSSTSKKLAGDEETTQYAEDVPGDEGNDDRPACFDKTRGYVGITQRYWDGDDKCDRVLLSPAQVTALIAFVNGRS